MQVESRKYTIQEVIELAKKIDPQIVDVQLREVKEKLWYTLPLDIYVKWYDDHVNRRDRKTYLNFWTYILNYNTPLTITVTCRLIEIFE